MELFLVTLFVSPLFAHETYAQNGCPGGVCPYMRNKAAAIPITPAVPMAQPAPVYAAPATSYMPPTPQFALPPTAPSFIGGSQPLFKPSVLPPQAYPTSFKPYNHQKFATQIAKPSLSTHHKIPEQQFSQSDMPYSSLLQSQLKAQKNSDNTQNDKTKVKKEKKVKVATPLGDVKSLSNTDFKENSQFIKYSGPISNGFSQSEKNKNVVFSLPLKKILSALNGRNSAELKLLFTPSAQNSDEISVSYAFSNVNDSNNAEPLLVRAANQVSNVTHNIVEGSKNMFNNVVDVITPGPAVLPKNSSNIDQIKIDTSLNDAVNAQAALDASNAISAY